MLRGGTLTDHAVGGAGHVERQQVVVLRCLPGGKPGLPDKMRSTADPGFRDTARPASGLDPASSAG